MSLFSKRFSIVYEGALLLCFLVLGMSLTPLTVLLEIDFALDKLAVLARPVIDAAALGAGQFEKLILRHNERNYTRIEVWSQPDSPISNLERSAL